MKLEPTVPAASAKRIVPSAIQDKLPKLTDLKALALGTTTLPVTFTSPPFGTMLMSPESVVIKPSVALSARQIRAVVDASVELCIHIVGLDESALFQSVLMSALSQMMKFFES